jgi:hypothetical protein
MLLMKTFQDLKAGRVRCQRPGKSVAKDAVELSDVTHIECGMIRWTMKELADRYNGRSVRYLPLAACRRTAQELLALQQVQLPTYLRPDPYPDWVLSPDERELREFKGVRIGTTSTSPAMSDDKAKVEDATLKEVEKRPGVLTPVDYMRMFKPANSSASWYTVAKMDVKSSSQTVGKTLPAAPVVCPVQCGPEDEGGYVEAWGLEGAGAAMGAGVEAALEMLVQAFGATNLDDGP